MARRTVGRAMVRAPRRPTFWEGGTFAFTLGTGASATLPVVTEANLEQSPNPTLIRIRGEVIINVTARTAAQDACVLGMGIIPQGQAAITVGVTAMPKPITQIGSPWIWHQMVSMRSNVAPVNGTDLLGNARIPIDNKSMRKFDLNQGLQLVVENSAITGTITLTILFSLRVLFKR